MIPESFIEELKYASDIEQVVSSYVSLKRRGRNLTGLCPFHSEKTPSFTVYPDNQSYYCFGCGNGGDVITFIRQIEHLEYTEALRFLAGKAGMTLPEDAAGDKIARQKGRILEINREAARFFHATLTGEGGKEGLSYLRGRGLTSRTIRTFGLGWAPESWDSLLRHLREKGFSREELLAAAVVQKGRNDSCYDLFRGRIIFPIIDLRGNVIGFGGRTLGERGPKYLNSPDTPVFKKSRNLYALGFAKAEKPERLLLAEGYMDVISVHQAGFRNVVATLGTSLTEEQARLISQLVKRVVIAYDSDAAGQKAAQRAINLFAQTDVSVSILEMTGAKDPDEYIKKFGAARFGKLIEEGRSAIGFEIDKLRAQFDLEDPDGKVAFLSRFCQLMAGIDGELQRDVYISRIAREMEVGKERLVTATESIRKKRFAAERRKASHNLRPYAQDKGGALGSAVSGDRLGGLVAEEKLIALLLQNPDYYNTIRSKLCVDDFLDETNRQIFATLNRRLAENRSIEPIHLSAELPSGAMAKLSRLLVETRGIPFYREQAETFMDAIKAQTQRKSADEVKGMSDAEYESYITSLTARKK